MATRSWCRDAVFLALLFAGALLRPVRLGAQNLAGVGSNTEGTLFTQGYQWETGTKPGVLMTTLRLRQVGDTRVIQQLSGDASLGTFSDLEGKWRYTELRPGRIWMLSFRTGGQIYNPRFSGLDSNLGEARFQGQQRLVDRLYVKLSAHWANLPSGGLLEIEPGQIVPASPLLTSGDENLPFLLRRLHSKESALNLEYHSSMRTSFAWGGSLSDIKFEPQTLFRSRVSDAYAAVFHQWTRRQTIGFSYSSMWLEYPGQPTHSRVDNFLATYLNHFTNMFSLSVFGGPALLHQVVGGAALQLPQRNPWSVVGGATGTTKLGHTELSVKYNRSYMRGAILLGTTLRQATQVNLTRQMTRRLTLSLGGNYAANHLGQFQLPGYRSYDVHSGIRYQLGPRMWLNVSDTYVGVSGHANFVEPNRNLALGELEIRLPDLAMEK